MTRPPVPGSTPASQHWSGARFALLLGILIAATFPEILFGLATFYVQDYGAFGYPHAFFHRSCFWQGEWPLWNPYNNCGIPFLAQWSTLTFYPLSLFYLLLPMPWSLGVFSLLHMFMGGLGMYHLVRSWTERGLPASVAGITYAMNGMMFSQCMWPHAAVVLGWLPWVVLTTERAALQGGTAIVIAGVLGALQLLGGLPEYLIMTWGIICSLVVLRTMDGAVRPLAAITRMTGVIAMVAGLTAFQTLPFVDLFLHSSRSAGTGDPIWAMPGTGWANLLVPLFNCYQTDDGGFHQLNQWYISSYYLGIVTLLLGLAGVILVRTRLVRWLGCLTLLGLVLALGDDGHVYLWLRQHLPVLNIARYPVKFMFLALFCLPILAGHGIARCTDSMPDIKRTLPLLAGILTLLIAALLIFDSHNPLPWEDWHDTLWNGLARVLILMFGTWIVMRLARKPVDGRQWVYGLALCLALWGDIVTHSPGIIPTVPLSVYAPGSTKPTTTTEPPRPGHSRLLISSEAGGRLHHGGIATNPVERYLITRLGEFAECNLLDAVPKVDGFNTLQPRDESAIEDWMEDPVTHQPTALADFAAVSLVTKPGTLFTWSERTNAMPMVFSGQRVEFASDVAIQSRIRRDDFDPRRVVMLPSTLSNIVTATTGATAVITLGAVTMNEVNFHTTAGNSAIVTIAQTYYHHWRATVDGVRIPIWKANYAFQAIEVPSGGHDIQLTYVDTMFRSGIALSLLTVLLAIVYWRRTAL